MGEGRSIWHHLFEVILHEADSWRHLWKNQTVRKRKKSGSSAALPLQTQRKTTGILLIWKLNSSLNLLAILAVASEDLLQYLYHWCSIQTEHRNPQRPKHLYFKQSHKGKSLVKSVKRVPKFKKEKKERKNCSQWL